MVYNKYQFFPKIFQKKFQTHYPLFKVLYPQYDTMTGRGGGIRWNKGVGTPCQEGGYSHIVIHMLSPPPVWIS